MTWTHYILVFRLESPLHIGYRKVGNLMQTRRYVPGKNLWAALTQRIVHLAGQGHNAQAYQQVGQTLKEYFRFGYLWPAHATKDQQGNWHPPTRPHFPWDESDPDYWDYLYLDGTARTAQRPETRTADEGSLHEVEFIAPCTREGQPVYLVGDLWVKNNVSLQVSLNGTAIPLDWQRALQHLQIGGERTYGWGRVRCCANWQTKQGKNRTTVAGNNWNEQNGEIVLSLSEGNILTAHAKAVGNGAVSEIVGPVEPLVGWERNNKNSWKLSQGIVCWAPGGKLSKDVIVSVNEIGLWCT